jgi:endogenous inhibitor of DNA gyrase (YacG/DUF329 family)
MPQWVLRCPECNANFTHSEIATENQPLRDSFAGLAVKPEFPEGGMRLECPNCKKSSVYQRHELVFRAT